MIADRGVQDTARRRGLVFGDQSFPVVAFVAVAACLAVVVWVSVANFSLATIPKVTGPRWRAFPDMPWFDGWARFDSGWYDRIAREGYWSTPPPGQSPIAFFPAYPLAMRAMGWSGLDLLIGGMLVTFACGLGASVVFFRWCRARLGSLPARYGLAAMLLYPFGYYLVGAVYADALFLVSALLAFVALEHDRPGLAGLAGAVATAARPVGGALVVGLVVLTLERRGVFGPGRRFDLGRLRGRDLLVLTSAVGLVAYSAFLWNRFGDPLGFASAMEGWKQPAGVATWLKFDVWAAFGDPGTYLGRSLLHAALAFGALALVPRVVRRLGWGYGVYVFTIVFFPALATKDFVGMGRYVLAAFPIFAVGGEWLAEQRGKARWVFATSGVALVVLTSMYSRWFYVS